MVHGANFRNFLGISRSFLVAMSSHENCNCCVAGRDCIEFVSCNVVTGSNNNKNLENGLRPVLIMPLRSTDVAVPLEVLSRGTFCALN
jgi:hypothetical protein